MAVESPTQDTYRGKDLTALGIDQAYLAVMSDYGGPNGRVFVYTRNGNCDGCPYQRMGNTSLPFDGSIEPLSTHYPWFYRFRSSGEEDMVLQSQEDR